jgi:phosphodiesterase/alkaline phosphatase D-like protein
MSTATSSTHPAALIRIEHEVAARLLLIARAAGAISLGGFIILLLFRGVPRSVDRAEWEPAAQLVALGLVAGAYTVSWKWAGLGGWCLLVTGVGLGVFASLGYQPTTALLAALPFVLPGLLMVLDWQRRSHRVAFLTVAVTIALLLGTGGVVSARVYDYYYGPTHPESRQAAYDTSRIRWVWTGAVGPDSITVKARLANTDPVNLRVWKEEDPAAVVTVAGESRYAEDAKLMTFTLRGLDEDTAYHYGFTFEDGMDATHAGAFRTLPDGPASYTIALGSCLRTASNGQVFDRIREAHPLLILITGDFNYSNIASTDPSDYATVYGENLGAPAQQALYLQAPIVYSWDDHDYGGNGSDSYSRSRDAVREAYAAYVPHYPLAAGGNAPIYQAFTIGRVRFLLTDTRSERDPLADPPTMLGPNQKQWLKTELLAAKDEYALTVWVNGVPWIADDSPGADSWGGFADERAELGSFISAHNITNLAMVSGDAHMIAIDNGTNSNYSEQSGPAFPVFHAAALDRRGNVKGGPYSEGAFPGGGHFGLMTVTDNGEKMSVLWSGRDYTGAEIVHYVFTIPASSGS